MQVINILCEGPRCNAGFSAKEREDSHVRALTPQTYETQAAAETLARSRVSRELRYTPHVKAGADRYGRILCACQICGHERIYGTSMFSVSPYA